MTFQGGWWKHKTAHLESFYTPRECEHFQGSALLLHCRVKTELTSYCPTETRGENFYFTKVAAPSAEGRYRAGKQDDEEKGCLEAPALPSSTRVQTQLEVTGNTGENHHISPPLYPETAKALRCKGQGIPRTCTGLQRSRRGESKAW